ncbi:MAG: histidine kinase dimerization/phospho-acceptor domain-containing protein, partial [Burkholderiaceae bacterium]
MKIASANRVTIALILVTSLISVVSLVQTKLAENNKYQSLLALNQAQDHLDHFSEGREILTEAMRGFATTGKSRFSDRYQKELVTDRHIEQAVLNLRQLTKVDDALGLIAQAHQVSDAMIQIERYILEEARPGDYRLSTAMAFDESYHELKVLFLDLLRQARLEITHRHQADLQRSTQQLQFYDVLSLLAVTVNFLVVILVLFYFYQRRLVAPLENLTRAASSLLSNETRVNLLIPEAGSEIKALIQVLANYQQSVLQIKHAQTELLAKEAQLNQSNLNLSQTNQALEQLMRLKSDFLANMSHEIRTPMNAIIGMTYLAQQGQPDAKLSNYLNKIAQASKQLLSIINDILDTSKIEAGKLEIEAVEFSLETVFEQ